MSKTIVLADDSVTIQKVVELTFMDEDYRVVAFGNGDEALSNLYGLSPDVVIADVHMPGASGYEVCRRVKASRPGVPVLLLVGTFEPFDEQQAKAAGADASLKKPFDSQELLRLVRRLLETAAATETAPTPAAAEPVDAEPVAATPAFIPTGRSMDDEPTGVIEPIPAPAVEIAATAPQPVRPSSTAAEATIGAPGLAAVVPAAGVGGNGRGPALSDEEIDRIARRVVEILSERILREVAWEVVPDLAEVVIKDRLRELESQVE